MELPSSRKVMFVAEIPQLVSQHSPELELTTYYHSHFPKFRVKMCFTTLLSVIIPASMLAIPLPLTEDSATAHVLKVR